MDWIFISQITLAGFIGSLGFVILTSITELKILIAMLIVQISLSVGITIVLQKILYKFITTDNTLAFGTALILGTLDPKDLRKYAKSLISYIIKRAKSKSEK